MIKRFAVVILLSGFFKLYEGICIPNNTASRCDVTVTSQLLQLQRWLKVTFLFRHIWLSGNHNFANPLSIHVDRILCHSLKKEMYRHHSDVDMTYFPLHVPKLKGRKVTFESQYFHILITKCTKCKNWNEILHFTFIVWNFTFGSRCY